MSDHSLEHIIVRRLLATLAAASTLFAAIVATAATDGAGKSNDDKQPYAITVVVVPQGEGQYAAQIKATERATKEIVWGPYLVVKPPEPGSRTRWKLFMSRPLLEFTVKVTRNASGTWIADLEMFRDGELVQHTTVEASALERSAFIGEPIDISLKDADIRDVLLSASQLAGLEIVFAPEVQGRVTINVESVPWDQVVDQVARDNGLRYRLAGAKLEVFK